MLVSRQEIFKKNTVIFGNLTNSDYYRKLNNLNMRKSDILKDVNLLTSKNPVFVMIDKEKSPLILIAATDDEKISLSKIAEKIFGKGRVEMAVINVPFDADSLKKHIDMLFDNKTSKDKKTVKDKKVIDSIKSRSVFSSRETEILQLIALEYTNEEIAEKLCLAKRTVDNHRVNLMQRVNAKNTAGLIGYAFRNGLVM